MINKYSIALSIIGFILYLITGITASIVIRFDPGFHSKSDFPIVYKVFMIILIIYCSILLIFLFFNVYMIFKTWNQIIPRHKVFFSMSFYFFFAFFLISLTGFYSSYDTSGVRILLIIFLGNFYVYLLTILWRFSNTGKKEFEEIK